MIHLRAAALFALCLAWTTARAEEPDVARRLAEYMQARADLGHFSGSALIARGDEVLLSRGYGFSDATKSIANSPETVYRVASITKQFAAMALLILEDRGKLRVTDKLSAHLPGTPPAWADVTLEHLLTHTSGIPDYESAITLGSPAYDELMGKPGAPQRILADARAKPLDFPPGSKPVYSNTGYVILGFVIEHVSGQPLGEFLTQNIFAPLGMSNTHHDVHGLEAAHRAQGFELAGEFSFKRFFAGFTFPADFTPAPAMWFTAPQADAALITTAPDLLKWSRALSEAKLVSQETLDRIFTPHAGGYGYGWIIDKEPGGTHAHHNGVIPGFVSRISRFTDENFTIILLGNTDQSVDRIAADLASILRGEPYTFPVRRTIIDLSRQQAAPLLGRYRDEKGRILEVDHDGTMVTVALKDRFVAGLLAESPTRFFGVMFNGPVEFELGPDGAATIDILLRGSHWRASRVNDAP